MISIGFFAANCSSLLHPPVVRSSTRVDRPCPLVLACRGRLRLPVPEVRRSVPSPSCHPDHSCHHPVLVCFSHALPRSSPFTWLTLLLFLATTVPCSDFRTPLVGWPRRADTRRLTVRSCAFTEARPIRPLSSMSTTRSLRKWNGSGRTSRLSSQIYGPLELPSGEPSAVLWSKCVANGRESTSTRTSGLPSTRRSDSPVVEFCSSLVSLEPLELLVSALSAHHWRSRELIRPPSALLLILITSPYYFSLCRDLHFHHFHG